MYNKPLSCILVTLFLYMFIELQNATVTAQQFNFPDVVKKQVKKVHVRCVNKTGVTEEIIASAHSGVLPKDPAFKCFLHCLFDIFGLIDSQNIMHLDALVEVVPEELHAKILDLSEKCGTQNGTDACDTVLLTVQCYIDTDGPFIKKSVEDMLT
ncbi:general odorant-binding protein 69a [Drosophila albomicans]|uniref:General odorant-binding protein 69a n=1 Tax=Drosophila albomicans TaxID=7291 RepID=A0A6P8X344_DROAB|nr:general odorant-binding protein 69a [Drosophila albomicans]